LCLFLDEFTEFRRSALEALANPWRTEWSPSPARNQAN
jgi:hypothetical protein